MTLLSGLFDWIFYPITNFLLPSWSLIVISFIITLLSTLAYKFLTNQKELKSLKEDMKILREEQKKHKDNPDKIGTITQQMMEKNHKVMKHSMRPMLFTLIPILLVFTWLKETFLPAGDLFSWGFKIWPWGAGIGWLWTYIISSVIFSTIIRKLFKIH